jgi:hypothetical protein
MFLEISHANKKIVTKRNLESLRNRKNPWLKSTTHKRLAAMAVICQTHDDVNLNPDFLDFNALLKKVR